MFNIDDIVKIKSTNLIGKIISINKNKITVKINNKNTIVDAKNIEKTDKHPEFKNINNININFIFKKESKFEDELMIRHLTRDEALDKIDSFINEALIHKVKIIKIVHGKNGGILRKATHEYLSSSPFVKSFRLGYPHEGSYGATVVLLK